VAGVDPRTLAIAMLNRLAAALATAVSPVTASVLGAFARLDGADQRLVEAALFDGWTCAEIARSTGAAPSEIRRRIGAAMQELHAVQMQDDETGYGAVVGMLALRALDALDVDEAAVIDAMLEQQVALMVEYGAYCELVGELCMMVPRIAPWPQLVERLVCADRDAMAN
jgi:hypothetical protein